jgi:aminoglycoside phosphotransferase (APT) family kinase protein
MVEAGALGQAHVNRDEFKAIESLIEFEEFVEKALHCFIEGGRSPLLFSFAVIHRADGQDAPREVCNPFEYILRDHDKLARL